MAVLHYDFGGNDVLTPSNSLISGIHALSLDQDSQYTDDWDFVVPSGANYTVTVSVSGPSDLGDGLYAASGAAIFSNTGSSWTLSSGSYFFEIRDHYAASYNITISASTGTHVQPTIGAQSFSVSANQAIALGSQINVTNQSSDTLTTYWIADNGGGTGHVAVGGATEPDDQWVQVGSNWSNVQYVGGSSAGTDTLALAVFDSTTNSYVYNSGTFSAVTTASVHVPASINAHSFSVSANSPVSASSFFSVSNPSGDNVSQYSFLDEGANGHFSVSGVAQPDGQWFNITPNNLSSVQYFGGPTASNENLEVAIFDATTNAGYEQLITATTTAPSQAYSITPVSPTIQENAGTEIFTVSRTDASQQATVVVSTVHDLGTDNPNMNTYYQGILNQPVTFNAGQYQVQIPLTIHDLYLTTGSESFRLIVQQTADPNYNNYLASDTFTIVNKDSSPAEPVHANDLGYSGTASGFNHFIDLLNFEASYGDLIHAFGTNQQAMQNWYSASEPHESRIETFDGLDYIASYGDLIHAFASLGSIKGMQDAGAAHFITNGLAEGRSTTFNGLDYIASYNDLMSAFGANNDAGAFHFIENGQREGRTATFDGLDYIASYGDLIHAFGANEQAGAAHFITNGHGEGRTTTFDGLSYIAQYTDLMLAFGTNGDAGAMHYITNGVHEGRTTAFNVAGYEQVHPDLIGVYNTNDAFLTAYIHTYTSTGHFLV
jgi:hypothetical protein